MIDSRHRLRLMGLSLIGFFILVVSINWVADPYNAWGTAVIDDVYRSNQLGDRQTVPYLVRGSRPITLLAGSSRTAWGIPVEPLYRDGVLNAGLIGASIDDIAAVLQGARQHPQLKRVIWGLDFIVFDEHATGVRDSDTVRRLQGDLRFTIGETLFSLDALTASRRVLLRAVGGRPRRPFASAVALPWPQPFVAEALERSPPRGLESAEDATIRKELKGWVRTYPAFQLSLKQMRLLRDTLDQMKAAGIETLLFIGPMSQYELECIRQAGKWDAFLEWKRQLAAVAPYWDFSGYGYADDTLCLDVVHFKPGVGHVIFRRVLGEDCSACGATAQRILSMGTRVDGTTVEQHLVQQDTDQFARQSERAHAIRLVADLFEQHAARCAMGVQ